MTPLQLLGPAHRRYSAQQLGKRWLRMINRGAGYVTSVQCALLYTTSGGERRIRVHTMAVPVVSDLGEMYKAADGPACASLLARLAVEKTLTSRLEDSRQAVVSRVLAVLKEYKALYATQHRMPNKLVLPEGLKLVPLYALAVMKVRGIRFHS